MDYALTSLGWFGGGRSNNWFDDDLRFGTVERAVAADAIASNSVTGTFWTIFNRSVLSTAVTAIETSGVRSNPPFTRSVGASAVGSAQVGWSLVYGGFPGSSSGTVAPTDYSGTVTPTDYKGTVL